MESQRPLSQQVSRHAEGYVQPQLFVENELGEEDYEHYRVRTILETMHDLGRMTVEQCSKAYEDWHDGKFG